MYLAIDLSDDKLIITVIVKGNMKSHVLDRVEELGMKRAAFVRRLIADDMEKCKENERPQIVYYGAETTFPSSRPLPKIMTSKKPKEMTAMMSTNAEMKRLIEETDGNPRKALKKVIRAEA